MAGRWLDFRGVPAAGWDAFYAECKRLGYEGVIRYIGAGSDGKQIHRAEYQAARRHGIAVLLVDELATGDAWDSANDFAAGQARAREARADATREGIPDTTLIFCAADAHASSQRQIDDAVAYARGFASVLGKARSGFYGFSETSRAVHAAGVVAAHWRCGSEPGATDKAWVHFWQRNTGTVRVLGVECDVNDQYHEITAPTQEDDDMDQTEVIRDSGPGRINHTWLNTNQLLNNSSFGLAALGAKLDRLTALAAKDSGVDLDALAAKTAAVLLPIVEDIADRVVGTDNQELAAEFLRQLREALPDATA